MKYKIAVFKPEKLKSKPGTFGLEKVKAIGFPNWAFLSTNGPPG
jgi:hypothetical protein